MTALKSKLSDDADERMIHVRLSAETHRLLRIRVADLDASIQDWVADLVEAALDEEPTGKQREAWRRKVAHANA